MSQGDWTKLTVHGKKCNLDEIASVVSMLDNGLMIEDYSDLSTDGMYGALIDETLLQKDKSKISVSIFVPSEKNLNEYISFLKTQFASLRLEISIELEGLQEENWAESWKQYYKPIHLGRITIVPAWEKYKKERDNEVLVTMDPGMAFGTGTHETTRLILSFLDECIHGTESVLDVGTGSGILAIAAKKLGAASCAAYDIDPVAVRVAKDNFKENHCEDIICGVSDLLSSVDTSRGLYDICTANIVADIIIRMAPSIGSYLKHQGKLIVSGIIVSLADSVREALTQNGFHEVAFKTENDWIALLFERN